MMQALWRTEGAQEILNLFREGVTGGISQPQPLSSHSPFKGAHPLLLGVWSDEWLATDFRGSKLRKVNMKILNDPTGKIYLVAIVPDGMQEGYYCLQVSLFADVPVQQVVKNVLIPDLMQLEKGIRVPQPGDLSQWTNYIGSLHVYIGDHVEICQVAGILTGMFFCKTTSHLCHIYLFLA